MPILVGVGAPGTLSSASGGKVYAYNNISESSLVVVAGANQVRQRITFHNPGASDAFIAPALIQTSGSSVAFTPSNAALGGTFRLYANGGTLVVDGECQGAWQAFAVTGAGTTNPLTVMETNV
jgi:hypothetical protein